MTRLLALATAALAACAPPRIPELGADAVAATPRDAPPTEACVLLQENFPRALGTGVVGGGSETWDYAIASVLVRHPAGTVLIDPAFGRSIADDLHRAGPMVTALLGTERTKTPLVEVMARAGLSPEEVDYAVLTHAHWDHTGGLGDLPRAKVLVHRDELDWMRPFTRFVEGGTMPHHLHRARERTFAFQFDGPPVDGFPASFDVFGDGAVVAVPLPGHTPGGVAWLVRGAGGTTWLFAGDTTWTCRGVEAPAHKTLRAVDSDLDTLSQSIARLHAFARHRPDVVVVPAHDAAALRKLPACGPAR